MINVKVNGITQLKQLKQLDGLNIEFAGLDFYKQSAWYMQDKIDGKELKSADFDIRQIGVFVNAGFDEIKKTIDEYGLDGVQLQGEESSLLCEQLSEEVAVIKVFRIPGSKISIEELIEEYDEVCDYYLFDIAKQADWKQLSKSKIEKPFFLSGSIGPGDIKKLKSFGHPDFFDFMSVT